LIVWITIASLVLVVDEIVALYMRSRQRTANVHEGFAAQSSGPIPGGLLGSIFGGSKWLKMIGRGERIGTSDPLVPNLILALVEIC